MKRQPLNTISRNVKCSNTKFDICFDTIDDRQGNHVEEYLVVNPKVKNLNDITGIAILPICKDMFGLIHIYRHALDSYTWEVPRGFVEPNEDSMASAVRELYEETGINVKKTSLFAHGLISPEPGIVSAKTELYSVNIKSVDIPEKSNFEELGHVDFKWFDSQEIKNLFKKNKIFDSTTLLLLSIYIPKLMRSLGDK